MSNGGRNSRVIMTPPTPTPEDRPVKVFISSVTSMLKDERALPPFLRLSDHWAVQEIRARG